MNAHFIDIDVILKTEQKIWIVSKENPKTPIIKMESWEFNIFKSGIYKSQNNKIDFNGTNFYLPNDFMDKLKVICRKNKIDISNLAISMREFIDPELIKDLKFEIDMTIFQEIINKPDEIYLIATKNNKNNYSKIIDKINEKCNEIGLKIENTYYLSETFYNRMDDEISYLKSKILIQHLIGYKTSGNVFTNIEVSEFDNIYYYDIDYKPINLSTKINEVIEKLLISTDELQSNLIKNKIRNIEKRLIVREVTTNRSEKFIEKIVPIKLSNIIKSFENFKWKK